METLFSLNEKIKKLQLANIFYENLNKDLKKYYIIRYLESLKKNCYYFNSFLYKKISKDNGKKIFQKLFIMPGYLFMTKIAQHF